MMVAVLSLKSALEFCCFAFDSVNQICLMSGPLFFK